MGVRCSFAVLLMRRALLRESQKCKTPQKCGEKTNITAEAQTGYGTQPKHLLYHSIIHNAFKAFA